MTAIVSPTTTERIVRTLGLTALFSVFSGWFIYDGWVVYPRANLEKAVESLDPVPDELPPINDAVTQRAAKAWTEPDAETRRTRSDVIAQFGPPGWERPGGGEMRYFGPGGMLGFSLSGDLVTDAAYEAGEKNDIELLWQKMLGIGLLPVAVGFMIQLVRVVTTRVVLSDDGLKVRGRPTIPFEAMESIDARRYPKKGYVDLGYAQNGKKKSVRLDDYVIREFRPIIGEICERCDIKNPLSAPKGADG